jgi:dihydrofolate reductase
MPNSTISLIAAIGKNRELGRGNKLIFDIPEDMKHFRDITAGHPIIMGRKTHESIGRVLSGRLNIVVSRSMGETSSDEFAVVSSMKEAIDKAKETGTDEVFIIGGQKVFEQAMEFADKLYLTVVDAKVPDADAFFPNYHEFNNIVSERKSKDANYSYTFLELTK